jgi:cell division protein FtsB
MTNDVTKTRAAASDNQVNDVKNGRRARSVSHSRPVSNNDKRVTGYTRVKSGELKKRSVTRSPDMSNPIARSEAPSVSIGGIPVKAPARNKAIPVASVHVEPTVLTVTSTEKASFPYSVVFLSLICSLMFFYMIFNYVQINERTSAVSDLKADIASLSFEAEELGTKLEQKNDLILIEQIATDKLGMVKIDEITKKYITMDPGDTITPYDVNGNSASAD